MKPQAKKPEAKEIVKHEPPPQELTAPDYLGGSSGQEGFEEVQQGDIKFPRLALAQALSPQLNEDDERYIPGLRKGEWFNTITKKVYGPELNFVPLMKYGNRLRFRDLDKGGGILCRSDDMIKGVGDPGILCAKCPYAAFGSARGGEGKGTECNEFFNFPVMVIEEGDKIDPTNVAILSMKSSHIDAAKQLIGLAMRRKLPKGDRAPMWAGVYSMATKLKKFPAGSSYIPLIDNNGWISRVNTGLVRDAYKFLAELRESLRKQGKRIVTDVEEGADRDTEFEPGGSEESNT